MITPLVRNELKKHRRVMLILGWLIVLLVLWMYLDPIVAFHRVSRLSPVDADLLRSQVAVVQPAFAFNYGLSALAAFGPFLMAFLGAHVIGSEFRWRTLGGQLAYLRRREMIDAKLLVLVTSSVVIILGMLSLVLLASLVASSILQDALPATIELPLSADLWPRLPIQLIVVWSSLMVWGAVALLSGVVLRSTALGFLAPIAWAYFEWLFGPLFGPALRWLPVSNQIAAQRVFEYVIDAGIVGPASAAVTIPLLQSIAIPLAYAFLAWRASIVMFRRQEIT